MVDSKYYRKNPEKYINEHKIYYRKNIDKEKKRNRNYNKIRYQDPIYKEKVLSWSKQRYENKKDEIKEKNRIRWKVNKERYNEQQRLSYPIKKDKLKTEVLTHYGNGKLECVCCGTQGLVFLTLDHINGRDENERGNNRKKKVGRILWSYVKRLNYPEGYQTLCWNCNSGRQINKGICPHKLVS